MCSVFIYFSLSKINTTIFCFFPFSSLNCFFSVITDDISLFFPLPLCQMCRVHQDTGCHTVGHTKSELHGTQSSLWSPTVRCCFWTKRRWGEYTVLFLSLLLTFLFLFFSPFSSILCFLHPYFLSLISFPFIHSSTLPSILQHITTYYFFFLFPCTLSVLLLLFPFFLLLWCLHAVNQIMCQFCCGIVPAIFCHSDICSVVCVLHSYKTPMFSPM